MKMHGTDIRVLTSSPWDTDPQLTSVGVSQRNVRRMSGEASSEGNFPGVFLQGRGFFTEKCPGGISGRSCAGGDVSRSPCIDYRSLRVAVMICDILVNTQTDTQTAFDPL